MKVSKPTDFHIHRSILDRYIVTEAGQVLSRIKPEPMATRRDDTTGLWFVDASLGNGERWRVWVPVLVALRYVQLPSDIASGKLYEVKHINGQSHDNRAANLQWSEVGTHSPRGYVCRLCGQAMKEFNQEVAGD